MGGEATLGRFANGIGVEIEIAGAVWWSVFVYFGCSWLLGKQPRLSPTRLHRSREGLFHPRRSPLLHGLSIALQRLRAGIASAESFDCGPLQLHEARLTLVQYIDVCCIVSYLYYSSYKGMSSRSDASPIFAFMMRSITSHPCPVLPSVHEVYKILIRNIPNQRQAFDYQANVARTQHVLYFQTKRRRPKSTLRYA
jgi:hypothetical protein